MSHAFERASRDPHGRRPLCWISCCNNPNASNPRNGAGATNPFRLSPAEAATADQDHGYKAEQQAFDAGAMDLFPRSVGAADGPNLGKGIAATTGLTMGYYDGNTVTAMWNYAQHYAMSDRFFGTTFGPSAVGAVNLISGQTNGVVNDGNAEGSMVPDGNGGYTLLNNANPLYETCASSSELFHMTGKNIGDLLERSGRDMGFLRRRVSTLRRSTAMALLVVAEATPRPLQSRTGRTIHRFSTHSSITPQPPTPITRGPPPCRRSGKQMMAVLITNTTSTTSLTR